MHMSSMLEHFPKMLHLLFILIYLNVGTDSQQIHSVAGPFRVVPEHIEHCPPEIFKKELATWAFRGTRDRKNIDVWYYFGNYTLHFNFDDDHHAHLIFASLSSRGGWKENALVLRFRRICTTGRTYLPGLWKRIMDSVTDKDNLTRKDCPFPPEVDGRKISATGWYRTTIFLPPKSTIIVREERQTNIGNRTGPYKLNNIKADLGTAKRVPAFFYGQYRMDFKIVDSSLDCISCMRIFLAIVPRIKYGSQLGANTADTNETTELR